MTTTGLSSRFCFSGILSLAALAACTPPHADEADGNKPRETSTHEEQTVAAPDLLSTVGLYDGQKTTKASSNNGVFAIENLDGVDTLTLDGKPAFYTPAKGDFPAPVEANESVWLVGVFELPDESVAWAVIIGGFGCAGTHILVSARKGLASPGQQIPGCDDRGTIRKVGDQLNFEAGGSEGTYQNGMLAIASDATKIDALPQP